jgi:ribonuclease BN (tRNA processing enzyme)
LKITVLGNYGPYPKAGGACSGYLFEHNDTKILLDCGNGTLSKLLQIIKNVSELDIILISHLHSDHISDAMILRYAIALRQPTNNKRSIPLYVPSEPKEVFNQIQFQNAFSIHKIEENLLFFYKDLTIRFQKMDHTVSSYSICIENNNKKFVYSSDTKYCNALLEIARNADLFLCESAVLEKDKTSATSHLSPKDAGKIAKQCNVKKLVLTHFWPEYDLHNIFYEARKTFDGELILCEEMKTYYV